MIEAKSNQLRNLAERRDMFQSGTRRMRTAVEKLSRSRVGLHLESIIFLPLGRLEVKFYPLSNNHKPAILYSDNRIV